MAEREAGYCGFTLEPHRSDEGYWKQDHQVGIHDAGLAADWEALGEETLRFGRYKGRTYMQVYKNESESASSWRGWVMDLEDPHGKQLPDLQAWLGLEIEDDWSFEDPLPI